MIKNVLRGLVLMLALALPVGGMWFFAAPGDDDVVTVYSSADSYVVEAIARAFEAETGLRVRVVGDTEATKTFGLVQRLRSEAGGERGPGADVWWSSEPFGTIALARDSLFTPLDVPGWPERLTGGSRLWHGFGERGRVIAYAPARVDDPPRSLRGLLDERFERRVGIARPQFGTTRGHFAGLVEAWGEAEFESWLSGLRDHGVRLYAGNADVVRAIALGEIDVGLTDTDDVFAAQANGLGVELVRAYDVGVEAGVPMSLPNTVALVNRGPNPGGGEAFARFLLGETAARVLAATDSRNAPVDPRLREQMSEWIVEEPAGTVWPGLEAVAARLDDAVLISERVLGR